MLVVILWSFDQISTLASLLVIAVLLLLMLNMQGARRMRYLRDRKRLRAQIDRLEDQKSSSFNADALNSLPSPIIVVEASHRITFANTGATDLFQNINQGDDIFLHVRHPSLVQRLEKMLQGDTDIQSAAIRFETNDERSFDVTVSTISGHAQKPVSDDQHMMDKPEDQNSVDEIEPVAVNNEASVILFFVEVTSTLQTEQMRVDFVANASHELRTPLASVLGSIETLQGPAKDDPEGSARFLSIMQNEAERMARLIDDLLSLSRIELERYKKPDSPIPLYPICKSIVSTVAYDAKKRGMEIVIDAPKDLPDVLADTDQIIQVLLNLVTNSIKYADPETQVIITAYLNQDGTHVDLSVQDFGPGISPEHLARLTERFYRVDTARSRQMGGTGLGLAIVKHILLRHGTNLDVQSQLDKGSSFTFKLPVADIAKE